MRNVVQVMGPGCANEELQHCPPEYHFELTSEELMEAIRDPRAVGRALGLGDEIGSVQISVPKDQPPVVRAIYCCRNCLTDSICCIPWPEPVQ